MSLAKDYHKACKEQGLPITTSVSRFVRHHRANAGLVGYVKGRFLIEDDNADIDVCIRDLAVEIADVVDTPDFQRDPNSNQDTIDLIEEIIRRRAKGRE